MPLQCICTARSMHVRVQIVNICKWKGDTSEILNVFKHSHPKLWLLECNQDWYTWLVFCKCFWRQVLGQCLLSCTLSENSSTLKGKLWCKFFPFGDGLIDKGGKKMRSDLPCSFFHSPELIKHVLDIVQVQYAVIWRMAWNINWIISQLNSF